jgi:hypothetical protein
MKYPKLMKYPKRWKYQFFGSCYFPYRKLWWTVIGGSPKRFSEKSIPNFWPFPSQLLVEKIALFCWWFGTWLLFSPLGVWNMAFIFPNSWDDDPIWLSYFSEGWLNHQPVPVWRLWNHIRSKSHFIANPNLRNTIVWLVVAVTTILFVGNLQGKKGGQPVFWSWKPRNYGNYPMNFIPLLSRYYPNNHPRNY